LTSQTDFLQQNIMVHRFPNDGAAELRLGGNMAQGLLRRERSTKIVQAWRAVIFDCASHIFKIDANCRSIPVKVSPIPRLGIK